MFSRTTIRSTEAASRQIGTAEDLLAPPIDYSSVSRGRLLSRIAANLWLLATFKDWSSILAMKGRSNGSGPAELRIRGLDAPVRFRPGSTDIPVVWELFHNAEYECDPWPFRTVIDCGANVGMFLAWLKRRGRIDRYIGVEADANSFGVLEEQLTAMRLGGRGSIFNAAVWDRNGQVKFDIDHDSWGRHVSTGDDGVVVRALTLDAVMDAAGVGSCDLLKLDIEGGEAQVLPYVMEHCANRIECVVVELHGGLDYRWFSTVVATAGFIPFPAGSLFKEHPGAVRRDSKLAALLVEPRKHRIPNGAA